MSDLNNLVLKRLVKTLQGQIDELKTRISELTAENKQLQSAKSPFDGDTQILQFQLSCLTQEKEDLNKQVEQLQSMLGSAFNGWGAFTPYSAYNDVDNIILCAEEENKRLRRELKELQDNYDGLNNSTKFNAGDFDEAFTYAAEPVMLAPFGTNTVSIPITREADFYVTKIVRESNGPFAFLIRDTANDRMWSNRPLHCNLGAGTANKPYILPKPRCVPRKALITIELTDMSGAANEVRIALPGYKVYCVENLYCAT